MRRSGNTTRLIDAAIQELFIKGSVYIPTGAESIKLYSKERLRGCSIEEIKIKRKFIDDDFFDYDNKFLPKVQDDFKRRFERRLYTEHSFSGIETDGFIYRIKKVN